VTHTRRAFLVIGTLGKKFCALFPPAERARPPVCGLRKPSGVHSTAIKTLLDTPGSQMTRYLMYERRNATSLV
jgi:hypothetical protein